MDKNNNIDFRDLLNKFEPYYIMTIIMIGFIGNAISIIIFSFTTLR